MKNKKLHNIDSPGFSVPKDYFESLDESLLNIINEEKLKELSSDSGFEIPKNYFDELGIRLEKHLHSNKKSRVINLFDDKILRYATGVAAAIVILMALTLTNSKPSFDNLENETVENFVIDEDISSYEIASLLSEDQLDEEVFISHDLNEENLENYLLNTSDIEALIIE